MGEYRLFTSESVMEGHPDKLADQISDAVLDAIIAQDKTARVACETMVNTGMVLISGEITTSAWVNLEDITRQTVKEIGYNNSSMGFDWESCAVLTAIGKQSPDIAQGVDETAQRPQGAGDQGLMFGYASNETETLMPAPIYYAHLLARKQSQLRKNKQLPWLRPDGKSQVTLCYADDKPVAVHTVVLSTQHEPEIKYKDLEEAVIEEIIKPVLPSDWITPETRFLVNPTGRFVVGGPLGDCGFTGRKIIVDTYGGTCSHGGGCFSGKDPSKVDRSAAYMARYIAKNLVAAGIADRIQLQVSYAIGVAEPISLSIDTFGTGKINDSQIVAIIKEHFDLTPRGIISTLDLLKPIYKKTACCGHFGRDDVLFSWEKTDRADELSKYTE